MGSIKIKVTPVSYEDLAESGFDLPDNDNAQDALYAKLAQKGIMSQLTEKQRRVVICLNQGLKRPEVASHLLISTQEVHQIILRIRDRLRKRQDKSEKQYGRSQMWERKNGKR